MTRLYALCAAVLALTVGAAAQNTMPQPGPQGTNQNQNAPQMQTSPAQPSTAPGNSTTRGTTPNATKDAGKDTATTPHDAAKDAGGVPPSNEAATYGPATKTPHTEIIETPSSGPLSADPLLQPPPMPPNKSTLVGGIAKKIDRIRNRVVVAPFGSSKSMSVQFDERSHIYRDGRETTMLGIHPGDRIYVDTMLVGPKLFARNLRVVTSMAPAEASGQVIEYDQKAQLVRIVDKLTGSPVVFHITPQTELSSKNGGGVSDLKSGSIVSVSFAPGRRGGDARQVQVLAVPGTNYLFSGRVTNLDLHLGVLNLENQSDGKNYELHFNPSTIDNVSALRVGTQIASNATFDGHTYTAKNVTVMAANSESAQQ